MIGGGYLSASEKNKQYLFVFVALVTDEKPLNKEEKRP